MMMNYYPYMKCIFISILFLSLVACGGGGGDDSSSSDDTSSSTTASSASTTGDSIADDSTTDDSTTDDSTTDDSTTDDSTVDDSTVPKVDQQELLASGTIPLEDLVVGADNTLSSEYSLFVGIQLGDIRRAYVSICEKFNAIDSGYRVDYDSCVLRGPLNEGVFASDVLLGSAQRKLIVAIWLYDGSRPIYYVWNYDDNADSQSLMIN
ncbi:hypothetical protein [Shewanella surugensis]|uniref:Lipoprotein n=1 Tax=Shewanella surugensis TaxID=212020 RepID=A0ABT0LDF8_9GAMM|nr:hypothetical protein [Shewanella surugensis]MCL1125166.1 hypothetical protein [Shewanella surugensis]